MKKSKIMQIIREEVIKTLNGRSNGKWIVDDVYYTEYGDILSIKLSNGYELIPDEDTGGEFATLEIKDVKLKKGDKISFDAEPNKFGELWGIDSIDVNGKTYHANVSSEGGNTATYLIYRKY